MFSRGTELGDYVVEKTLGEGAVAVVYRVRHRRRGTIHALKVLCVQQSLAQERMLLEARIQQRILHPNVVRVADTVRLTSGIGLVMDYVSGPTLQAWLARNEPDLEEALRLFSGIVRGVAAAHDRGVIHRDLKPANFLLDGDAHAPTPRLTDFGIVKVLDDLHSERPLTHSDAFLGSPSYMAPEQALDPRRVDRRSDLWSLGCILYELLLHRPAFPGDDRVDIANRVRRGEYEPLGKEEASLPVEVAQALRDLLQVDPLDRIQSCQELWQRLEGERRWGPMQLPADAMEPPSIPTHTGSTFMLSRSAILPTVLYPVRTKTRIAVLSTLLVLLLLWTWWLAG